MYGSEIGKLEVNMRVGNDISETIVWELNGNQENSWKQGQAPFLSRGQNLEVKDVATYQLYIYFILSIYFLTSF